VVQREMTEDRRERDSHPLRLADAAKPPINAAGLSMPALDFRSAEVQEVSR
jgi:hypothetical protein